MKLGSIYMLSPVEPKSSFNILLLSLKVLSAFSSLSGKSNLLNFWNKILALILPLVNSGSAGL